MVTLFFNVFNLVHPMSWKINDEYENAIDELAIVMQHVANGRKNRQRVAEFFTENVPAYSPDEFSSHFRIRRETFEKVCRQVIQ